jgi:flavin-dependent dehydrogenase
VKILVAGAGPAGLYFAYLAERARPAWHIRVVEHNRRGSTFGFGVVFSDRALEFLRGDDSQTFELIVPAMQIWSDLVVVHRGTPVRIDGICRHGVQDALPAFEAARRPIVEKLVAAADASGEWYDRFPEHMQLSPREFAWSYIQRSGRIDPERLRKTSPDS